MTSEPVSRTGQVGSLGLDGRIEGKTGSLAAICGGAFLHITYLTGTREESTADAGCTDFVFACRGYATAT